MSPTRRLHAAVALACVGVVLTGCSSGKKNAAAPASSTAVTSVAAESSSSSSDSDFDITLVPATPTPAAGSSSPASSTSSTAPAVTPSAKPTPSAAPSPSPTPAIAAGRVFAFIKKVDVATRILTYDQAQFLTGDAANKAAAEDKQEVPVPNDYYIRNVNKMLRKAPVAPGAALLGSISLAQQVDLTPVTIEQVANLAATDLGAQVGFWITVDGQGRITKVEEQYVP